MNYNAPTADADTEFTDDITAIMLSMAKEFPESKVSGNIESATDIFVKELAPLRKLSVHEVLTLRILATTKECITLLQKSHNLGDSSLREG